MIRRFTYTVTTEESDSTIADFLRSKGCTQHLLAALKRQNPGILRNQIPINNTGLHLKSGDTITICIHEEETSEKIDPVPVPFRIVYEDDDILVVDKGPDTPIHPSQNNHGNTLANGIAYYYAQQGKPFVFRCVNRLDRNTSGLVLLAKHSYAAGILSKQMAERRIHRTYRALVAGHTESAGTIDLPIGRKEGSIIEREVNMSHGDRAVTHYRTLSYSPANASAAPNSVPEDYSLIELHLDTGRTHQIRVHMSYIGHPLLGDDLYNPTDTSPLKRQALHSYALEFPHPIRGNICRFTAEMPEDLLINGEPCVPTNPR